MHTTTVKVDGIDYHVHHNGDWSGEALVAWVNAAGDTYDVRLPARLFVVCGRNAAIDAAIATLEELYEGP